MSKDQFKQILESLSIVREDGVRVWPTTQLPVKRRDIELAGLEYTIKQFSAEMHAGLDFFEYEQEIREEQERDMFDDDEDQEDY